MSPLKKGIGFGAAVALLVAAFFPSLLTAITSLPQANSAQRACRAKSGVSIAVGAGVHWSGMVGSAFEGELPSVGGMVDAIVLDDTLVDSMDSNVLQVGLSNAKLLSGAAIAIDDKLTIVDSSGRWGAATSTSQHVYYVAKMATGAAGNLIWARPIGNELAAAPVGSSGRVLQVVSGSTNSDQTTTSSSLADLSGCSATLTIASGSTVEVTATFSSSNTSALGARNTFVLDRDTATEVFGSAQSTPLLGNSTVAGAVKKSYSGLSASSHLFKVRWATSGGTARVRPATVPNEEHCSIVATEIGG